jgi:hypothetical protein
MVMTVYLKTYEVCCDISVLSPVSRRYLTMSATSVPVERLFSVTGQVVTATRLEIDVKGLKFIKIEVYKELKFRLC